MDITVSVYGIKRTFLTQISMNVPMGMVGVPTFAITLLDPSLVPASQDIAWRQTSAAVSVSGTGWW